MLKSNLKVILAERDMKGKDLAKILGVSNVIVSKWVTNKSNPTTEKLYEMAYKLDVKVDDLYEYIPDEETAE